MRLLFVAPYIPTLIRTRPYHLVRTLVRRGHAVTLAAPWERQAEQDGLRALREMGVEVITARLTRPRSALNALRALGMGLPMQARFCWQPELAAQIAKRLAGQAFDAVHVEHLRGAEYGKAIQATVRQAKRQTPVVWDSVDCISLLFEQAARHSRGRVSRLISRLELPRTRRYEGRAVGEFEGVLAASARDAAALEALGNRLAGGRGVRPVRVLTNGVDTEYFTPGLAPASRPQVVLTGKMSYHANVAAGMRLVEEIMPLVWRQRPDAEVLIVGSAPARPVRQLAEKHSPRVKVLGHVADMRPHLQAAAAAVAPITYGAGIQNKVLEAMACGAPVVASPQASSALGAVAGTDLLLATEPDEFAQALLRLLDDASLRQQVGAAGRRYVESHHQWDRIVRELEGFYDEFSRAAAEHVS